MIKLSKEKIKEIDAARTAELFGPPKRVKTNAELEEENKAIIKRIMKLENRTINQG